MWETGAQGLGVMAAFAVAFQIGHQAVLPLTKACSPVCSSFSSDWLLIQSTYETLVNKKKLEDWQNLIISWLHASLCSAWITYCVWNYGPELSADLMHADVPSARLLLCMSAGYFLADCIDSHRGKGLTWDVGVHHVVVLTCYSLAIAHGMFAPYLMGTLVVEFNNVFLHARRLYLFAGGVKSTSSDFYMWNLFLLIGTYPLFRFAPHGWLIHRVWDDYANFPETWMFWTAFTGMLVMNVLNVVLFGMILWGDKDVLRAMRASATKSD